MTYDGHRVHPRRRMAPTQARRAPERADVDDQDDLDDGLAATGRDRPVAQPAVVTSLDGSRPAAQAQSAEPAPAAGARAFVEALALALCDAPPDALTPDQLDRLCAVLAVVAPALGLTTDPNPLEPTVPTTAPHVVPVDQHAPPEPEDGQRPSGKLPEGGAPEVVPVVVEDQGESLADRPAAEREQAVAVRAELDRLRDQPTDPARLAAARARADDEAAIATLREQLAQGAVQLAATTTHRIVSAASLALATCAMPASDRDALALIATVPTAELLVTVDGRVDVEAARTVLTAAARSAAGGAR